MFNKRSQFTLIELIVVIAVLGILAAIVIPNISNFQQKAKEVQLTADVRNMQTAVDMYRIDSLDGVSEPTLDKYVVADFYLDDNGVIQHIPAGSNQQVKINILNLGSDSELYPDFLRDIPDGAKSTFHDNAYNSAGVLQVTYNDGVNDNFTEVNWDNGEYILGTMNELVEVENTPGTYTASENSTAIVKAVSLLKHDFDLDKNGTLEENEKNIYSFVVVR